METKSKILKWVLGIFFLIGGLGFIADKAVISGILLLIIGVIILIPINTYSDKIYNKLYVRIIACSILFVITAIAYPFSNKESESKVDLTSETDKVQTEPLSSNNDETSDDEAQSTEEISTIDEPVTENMEEEPVDIEKQEIMMEFVLNTNTMKAHTLNCPSISDMNDSNRSDFTGTSDELKSQGYEACRRCKPW